MASRKSEEPLDLTNTTFDACTNEEWAISIDITLKQDQPLSTEGNINITKYDRKLKVEQSFMATAPPGPSCRLEGCCQWRHKSYDVKHNAAELNDRATVFVGETAVPIHLPKIFLTQHPGIFRTALDGCGQVRYAEAAKQEMRLPEENPRNFLNLVRYLIESPKSLEDLALRHWPYRCIYGEVSGSCCSRNLQINPHVVPYVFRFCAMVERLALDLLEPAYWDVLTQSTERAELLPQPAHVEWAMNNCLDDESFQRYVAKVLAVAVRSRKTPFATYEAVLQKNPKLCFFFAICMSPANFDGQRWFEWNEKRGMWAQHLA